MNPFLTRRLRTSKAIFLEDLVCTILLYLSLGLYAKDMISMPLLYLITFIYIIRVFTIRHERSHMTSWKKDGVIDFLSSIVCAHHTLYQEPYLEKRKKHLTHHSIHNKVTNIKRQLIDPHSYLEVGSWYTTLFFSFFYEETMFIADFKNNKNRISKDRWTAMAITSSLIALTIALVGLKCFLIFSLGYRLSATLVWHFFSYTLHHPWIEESQILAKVAQHSPPWVHRMTEGLLGSSHVTVVFFHDFHHKKPSEYFKF